MISEDWGEREEERKCYLCVGKKEWWSGGDIFLFDPIISFVDSFWYLFPFHQNILQTCNQRGESHVCMTKAGINHK